VKILALLFLAAVPPQDSTPAFEVASVKASPPPVAGSGIAHGCKPDPAIVNCTGATLKMLLMRAYKVRYFQIEGPAWIETENYEVSAKVPEGAPAGDVPAMLATLLAQRFAVKLHKETRMLPSYDLMVAKGGPKLREIDPANLPAMPEPGSALPPSPGGRGVPPPVSKMPVGVLGVRMNSNGATTMQGNVTMGDLASYLTGSLSRPVFDRTGLKGAYAVELSYLGPEVGRTGDGPPQPDANSPIATLFQAVQTLGLKLEPKKEPLEMIVVDSANKVPSENR
jgi:uncharacterized protein (TIGR03435 family)